MLKYSKCKIALIVLIGIGVNCSFANKIMGPAERQAKIALAESLVEAAEPTPRSHFEKLKIPFIYIVERDDGNKIQVPVELTSDQILRHASASIVPRGRVFRNNEYFLIFDSGLKKKGDFLPVQYGIKVFNVMVEDITPSGYILRHKDDTLEINFSTVRSKRAVIREFSNE